MVFEIPVTINNHKIRKSTKVRYKYKFHLNKYHQENEVARLYGKSSEILNNNASNTEIEADNRVSALTPQPSEFEHEYDDQDEETIGDGTKNINYQTKVLSKYMKPEDQYEQWYLKNSTSDTQLQSQYPKIKDYQQIEQGAIKTSFVSARYVAKLKKNALKVLDDDEMKILSRETVDDSNGNHNSQFQKAIDPQHSMFMNKNVYNIVQIWHFAILDHNWAKAYRCFALLVRIPDIDIRSIWSLGCITLKNHQQQNLNLANDTSEKNNSNDQNMGIFSFNPQFPISTPTSPSESQHTSTKKLTYLKFLEWMCTVFSARTHFNQNTNYVKDPVWRKGSYKHTPIYTYTWLWSLLLESSARNTNTEKSATSYSSNLYNDKYGGNGDDEDDTVQWLIEKINDMLLAPPYMDDPMIKYIQACAHLSKADELVNNDKKNRNRSHIGQHVQSCKKILRGIDSNKADVPLEKQFYFNREFIEKQLQLLERSLYIDSDDDEGESDSSRSEEENGTGSGIKLATEIKALEDTADYSSDYNSDIYTREGTHEEDFDFEKNHQGEFVYSSSD